MDHFSIVVSVAKPRLVHSKPYKKHPLSVLGMCYSIFLND